MAQAPKNPNDVIVVSTHVQHNCLECIGHGSDGDMPIDDTYFVAALNHHRNVHGREILHIGTETSENVQGQLCSNTVAYLQRPQQAKTSSSRTIPVSRA